MDFGLRLFYAPHNRIVAQEIVDAIEGDYPELPVTASQLDDSTSQPYDASALVLLFDRDFEGDPARVDWLTKFDSSRTTTPLLPVALDLSRGGPPDPIAKLKSRFWPTDRDEILISIAACMGLALRPGTNKVFVSYRAVDGTRSAELVEQALTGHGFVAWRDESKTIYDAPNLALGTDVQKEIEENLSTASAMVLLDTPRAGESSWVRLEVEAAVGKMIPILPIVLHDESCDTQVCRFRTLQSLHRRAVVESTYEAEQLVLPAAELDDIVKLVERYLQSVYRNRVLHLRELERFLHSKNWSFDRNQHLPHLHSGRVQQATHALSLLACCSFEEQVFAPRVRAFVDGMSQLAKLKQMFNCNYYLYPGQTLRDQDLLEIMQKEVPELIEASAEVVSYNEAVARISAVSGGFGV